MRHIVLLFLAACLAAQTTPPKKAVKSKALIACEARTDLAIGAETQLAADNAELATQNAALKKKYEDAILIMRMLDAETGGKALSEQEAQQFKAVAPGEALNIGIDLEKRAGDFREAVIQLAKHDAQAVDHYNSLLSDYKDYVNRVNIRLSEMSYSNANQQRINNALALYSLMPKYTPPQTINVNVRNCSAQPALCVGH